jgi:predicted esterase
VVTLRDRHGRSTDASIGVPKKPGTSGRYGALILLHGLGGNASQVFKFGRALAPKDMIVIAPSAQKTWDGQKYEDLRTAAAFTKLPIMEKFPHWWSYQPDGFPLLALDHLLAHYPIDPERVVLLGYSMGGFGTWNIGLRYHDRFAALVPMAGGISREEFLLGKDSFCRDLLDNARDMPLFFAHGDADRVVPVKFDRWTAAGLEKRGIDFIYEEIPGGGHHLSSALKDKLQERLPDWIGERTRNTHPTVVEHRALRPYHPGAYWLRVDEFSQPSARVMAKAEGKTIDLEVEGARRVTVFLDPEVVDAKGRVTITQGDKRLHKGKVKPSLLAVAQSFERSRDPSLVYSRAVTLKID